MRRSFERQAFMATIGAVLDEVREGRVVLRLPFAAALTQQNGFLHGGVIATVADVAGGYASYSLFDDASDVLTVEFKLNLLAPALGPFVTAVGEVLRSGRTLTVCSLRIFDHHAGEPRLCAAGQQTLIRVTADTAGRRSAAEQQGGGLP
ncbi:MAG TPA: PaaI family thioesterase [Rhizorhapis sp.]